MNHEARPWAAEEYAKDDDEEVSGQQGKYGDSGKNANDGQQSKAESAVMLLNLFDG